jgi:hypothetical protein
MMSSQSRLPPTARDNSDWSTLLVGDVIYAWPSNDCILKKGKMYYGVLPHIEIF